MLSNRRIFLLTLAATGSAMAATPAATPAAKPAATAAPKLDEKDPQATALGYVSDTSKADQKKYPQHTAAQHCGACQLYQGKPGEAAAMCPIFAGRLVADKGWCASFIKKAG